MQVDECGLTIPRTLARMARERSVNLYFGPKRGQWRIEADLAGEARINQRVADGKGRVPRGLAQNNGQQQQRAASMRALSALQNEQSMRSTTSSESENQGQNKELGPSAKLPLDIARLALPITGEGREALRHELAKIQLIDDSVVSDQVQYQKLKKLSCKLSLKTDCNGCRSWRMKTT